MFQSIGDNARVADTRMTHPTMNRFCDSVNANQKNELDTKLAEMIYGLALPFSIVEPPFTIALLRSMRPAYKPPTR